MRFFTAALGTVVAFAAALISAQSTTGTSPPPPAVTDSTENQINVPSGGTIAPGSGITIRWTPSTPGPVTLILRRGDGNNLATVTTIASEIPNSGSYDWTPSESLPVGDDYSIQIISGGASNYSPKFGIGPPASTSSSSTSTTTSTGSSSTSSSSSSSSSTITSSSSSSSATTSATSSGANTTISSTSRTSSRSTPTFTSSGATGSATSTNGAAQVVSPLALVFFIAAGIAYLN